MTKDNMRFELEPCLGDRFKSSDSEIFVLRKGLFQDIRMGLSFEPMRRTWLLSALLLLVSLTIYLFYRTEGTVVNTLAASLLGHQRFESLRTFIGGRFPLGTVAVYSLPEMLWTAAFTLLSGTLYIRVFRKKIACYWIPLLVSVGLELLQLLPFFPGRFDWTDLLGSVLAWAVVVAFFRKKSLSAQNLFGRPNPRRFAFVACYAIMYLAHVWR